MIDLLVRLYLAFSIIWCALGPVMKELEIHRCLLNFHELLAQIQIFQIELAFDPCTWLALQRWLIACHWSFMHHEEDLTGWSNNVKASIADKGSLSTSVLVSDSTESEANTKRLGKSKFLINKPFAFNIGSVIEIELINAHYMRI